MEELVMNAGLRSGWALQILRVNPWVRGMEQGPGGRLASCPNAVPQFLVTNE